ncbi:MAG: DUF3313 domain-containing protein [Planctomycetes bacterium]|nr:DUF3313 domain-containing protein [Planctomycetota bacterium]
MVSERSFIKAVLIGVVPAPLFPEQGMPRIEHLRRLAVSKYIAGWLLIALFLASALTGCGSTKSSGPSPFVANPKPAGYVEDHERMKKDERFPFQLIWIDPARDIHPRKIYIAPVDTSHQVNNPWYTSVNTRYAMPDYKRDLADIAAFTRETVIKAFREDAGNQYPVVDSRDKAEIVLELSLVELVPAAPELVAAGWVVPGTSLANQPSVGFEGRVRDTHENKVVATFAFRDQPNIAVVDLQNMKSWYDSDKDVIRKWAAIYVDVINQRYDPKSRSKVPVSLLSW